MKPIIVGILSIAMILSFAACGANEEDQESSEERGTYSGYIAEKTMGDYIILTWSCPEGPLIMVADNKTEKVGALDSTGKMIIPCEYEYIYREGNDRYIVQKDGNNGIVDTKGNEIVPCEYVNLQVDRAGKEDLAVVQKTEEDLWGYISLEDGKTVIEPKFNNAGQFNGTDLAPVQFDNEKWGYIDRKGNTVIEPKYDEAWPFGELSELSSDPDKGFARVKMISDGEDDEGKEGVIDKTGKLVLPCKYDWVMEYRGGVAIVNQMDYSGEEDPVEYYGVVDTDGKEIIPMKKNVEIRLSNDGKYISVADIDENGASGKIRYYDLKGKEIPEDKIESMEAEFVEVSKSEDADRTGEEATEQDGDVDAGENATSKAELDKYANSDILGSGNFIVQEEKDGLWAITDKNGKVITDFIYNTEINRD